VILNSVVQYFPSVAYLLRVIEGAVKATRSGGFVFVGDVRSLPLLEAFHTSVEIFKSGDALSPEELQRRVRKRVSDEEELILDPAFFDALKEHLPQMSHVEILPKRGRVQNELTRFRYQVVIHIGEQTAHADIQRRKAWSEYANNPLQGKFARYLIPQLRNTLEKQLPDYMMPSSFVVLDEWPLTPGGKIDLHALPAPETARSQGQGTLVAPRTPVEQTLASLWFELLGLARVGIHDNFFESGGHSLLATQLISRVREKFQVEVTLRQLFERPTIELFATVIEEAQQGKAALQTPAIVPLARQAQRIKRSHKNAQKAQNIS